ncbi:hypothetical protein AMEX_G4588 [Astyanax mexicanus]|uniref:Uncharacterized protein n=1 Tax=Astyanax mexicanus TaxID=7994 RepID=A0A8T2MC35_ASTMX|nr:hypothetical protein AMEX_G4588 [Astyanax mexicanus]
MGFIGHRLFLLLVLAEVILIIFFIIFLIFYRSPKSKPQNEIRDQLMSPPADAYNSVCGVGCPLEDMKDPDSLNYQPSTAM